MKVGADEVIIALDTYIKRFEKDVDALVFYDLHLLGVGNDRVSVIEYKDFEKVSEYDIDYCPDPSIPSAVGVGFGAGSLRESIN